MIVSEIKQTPLEACGWFVRTKRTDKSSEGWIVADCSRMSNGSAYAELFAAAPEMLEALCVCLARGELKSGVRAVVEQAIAKATGG